MNAAFEAYGHFFTARYISGKPLMMRRNGFLRPIMFKANTPSLAILNVNETQSTFAIDNNSFVLTTSVATRERHFAYWKMPAGSTYSVNFSWSFSTPPEGESYGFQSTYSNISPFRLKNVPAANITEHEYRFYTARVNDVERVVPPPATFFLSLGMAACYVGGTDSLELVSDGMGGVMTNYITGDGNGLPLHGSASIYDLPLPYLRGGLDIQSTNITGAGSVTVSISFNPPE